MSRSHFGGMCWVALCQEVEGFEHVDVLLEVGDDFAIAAQPDPFTRLFLEASAPAKANVMRLGMRPYPELRCVRCAVQSCLAAFGL